MTWRALLSLLVLGAAAWADDVYFSSGRSITGVKVTEETPSHVTVVSKSLRPTRYPRAIVSQIVKKKTVVHTYFKKFEAADTADKVMDLAAWCKKKRFTKKVVATLHHRALELDPDHEAANLALGRVKYEGKWMTPAERDKRVADVEAQKMRASGKVLYKGQWVTPEEKERLEKGLKLYKGEWLTEGEIKRRQGYVYHEGKWIKKADLAVQKILGPARRATGLGGRLKMFVGKNYAVLGDLPEPQLQTVLKDAERLYTEFLRVFPGAKDQKLLEGKQRVYVFRKNPPYRRLVKWIFQEQKRAEEWDPQRLKVEEARMRERLRVTSFWITEFARLHPGGDQYAAADIETVTGHVQMPDPFQAMRTHVVHFGANVLNTLFENRARFPTWWLNEALAYYFEKRVCGTIGTWSTDVGGGGGDYAKQGPIEGEGQNPWLDASKWEARLLTMVQKRADPALSRIKGKDLYDPKNRLNQRDLAKGWSVVTYLIQLDRKKFAAFVRDAKSGPGSTPLEREAAAVVKHYGGYKKVDAGWRAFVLNRFRVPR